MHPSHPSQSPSLFHNMQWAVGSGGDNASVGVCGAAAGDTTTTAPHQHTPSVLSPHHTSVFFVHPCCV